jgi:hypothetical protein
MTLRKSLLMAAVLVLSVPVVPALAHDAHERAHEYGFYSRGEHRAYHRALRDLHDEAHGYQPAPQYYYYSRPRYYGYRGY